MPIHIARCTFCGGTCLCHNDEHALGCGGSHGEGGCGVPVLSLVPRRAHGHDPLGTAPWVPTMEFCSLACARELQRRLVECIANYNHRVKTRE